jgi:hypothetical protein
MAVAGRGEREREGVSREIPSIQNTDTVIITSKKTYLREKNKNTK